MHILQKTARLADPHMCSDAGDRLSILAAIFDALVRRDAAGRFVPALANRWAVADDARTWTFELRRDAVFHDGERLRAADVVGSLKRACDPSVGGELGTEGVWASYIGDAEIEPLDESTVRLVTARPMADLLEILIDIPVMSSAALAQMPGVFVGSGPYRLTESSDGRVSVAAFGGAVVRKPAVAAVTWRAEPEESARVEALIRGEADIASTLTRAGADRAAAGGARVESCESTLCVAFLFNAHGERGGDRSLRRGVNYAVDVERMIEAALGGAGTPLNGPLTPLHFGCDPALPAYAHDPERACARVAESSAGARLVVDLPTSLPDEAPLLGEMLAEDLAAVGIEVELRRFTDRGAYAEMVKAKGIDDLCCFDSSPPSTYRVLREKLDSGVAGPWWQGYDNPQVNTLLDTASRTVDDRQRRAVYQRAYRHIQADAPWLFLYRPTVFRGVGKNIADASIYR